MSPLLLLSLAIGAAAIFLLLPRPRVFPVFLGALTGLAALALAGWFLIAAVGWSVESFLFLVFSLLAIVAGVLLVTQRNPARAALSFALVVLSTCGLFMLLAAPFLMAATVVIYAGAIVVTFLFVLMLAQQEGLSDADARSREPLLSTITGFVLLGALVYVLTTTYTANGNIGLVEELLGEVRTAQEQLAGGETVKPDEVADRMLKRLYRITEDDEKNEPRAPADSSAREQRAVRQRADFAREARRRIETALVDLLHEPNADPIVARADTERDLARLARPLTELRQEQGFLRPAVGPGLSPLSGPPASTPAEELRVDSDGRPYLPAENAQYLGRSLFTDFLLPVELGGTLLLVATVGAIAIAQRRVQPQEKLT